MYDKNIYVGRECIINQEDFAPCMESLRGTAINVTARYPNTCGFVNFMLAIDSYAQCCENFGTGLVWVDKELEKEKYVYVEYILLGEDDCKIDVKDEYGTDIDYDSYMLATVYGENDKLICYGYVYNEHNGYYAHDVYINEDFNTEIDYL